MSDKVFIKCSCGGGAEVVVEQNQETALTECACGKTLFWSSGKEKTGTPPALSINVADHVTVHDKFGSN